MATYISGTETAAADLHHFMGLTQHEPSPCGIVDTFVRDAVRSLNGPDHACVCNDQHETRTAGMLFMRSLDPLPKRLPRLALAREVTEFSATPRIKLARMEFFDLVRREP